MFRFVRVSRYHHQQARGLQSQWQQFLVSAFVSVKQLDIADEGKSHFDICNYDSAGYFQEDLRTSLDVFVAFSRFCDVT